MRRVLPAITGLFGLLIAAAPMLAHHSFAAEYDSNKPIKFQGKVTKVEWMNPHAHFLMAVKDDSGKTTIWDFETGSPNALARRGVTRHSLKEGDVIKVVGYRAKDGSSLASAGTVTFSDGRSVFAGTSGDGGPTR